MFTIFIITILIIKSRIVNGNNYSDVITFCVSTNTFYVDAKLKVGGEEDGGGWSDGSGNSQW